MYEYIEKIHMFIYHILFDDNYVIKENDIEKCLITLWVF